MARYKYQGHTRDGNGNVIPSCLIEVFESGTSTVANIYTAAAGGTAVNQITSSSTDGFYEFWVDSADYVATQTFRLKFSKSGYVDKTYDEVRVFVAATSAQIDSVAWDGNDMVFTLTDATEITLANAKVDLKGDTGSAGAKGDTGLTGATGPQGPMDDDFTGAYDEKSSVTGNDTLLINDSEDANICKYIKISTLPQGGSGGAGITQTVLSSTLSSGLPAFITDPNDGLKVSIAATTTPVVISFSNGFDATGPLTTIAAIDADTTITGLTDEATNFLYAVYDPATETIALGKTVNEPYYGDTLPTIQDGANYGGGSEIWLDYNANNHWGDQSFKLTNGGIVSKISLAMRKYGSPTGNVHVEIQTDNSTFPSGTVVTNGTSANVSEAGLTTSYVMTDFTFATPPILSGGVQYHIVLKSTDRVVSATNYTSWSCSASGDYYTGEGKAAYCNNAVSWSNLGAGTTGDADFIVYSTPIFFFSVPQMKMYDYSTGSAVAKQLVFLGEAVTSAGQVTSVVNYALRGQTVTTPIVIAASTWYSFSHNIGVQNRILTQFVLKNISTDLGFLVGEEVLAFISGTGGMPAGYLSSRNIAKLSTGSSTYTYQPSSVGSGGIDHTKWKMYLKARRDF